MVDMFPPHTHGIKKWEQKYNKIGYNRKMNFY